MDVTSARESERGERRGREWDLWSEGERGICGARGEGAGSREHTTQTGESVSRGQTQTG
jgi:hypothetical protein